MAEIKIYGTLRNDTGEPIAYGSQVLEDAKHRFVTDAEKQKWNEVVLLPISGVCGSRAEKPVYGVWAFADEDADGIWTIEGDFASFGLTRSDYCNSVGIDGSRWVPKFDAVYQSIDPVEGSRLWVVVDSTGRMERMATKGDLDGLQPEKGPIKVDAADVTTDATRRFVSDAEKAKWDAAAIPVLLPIDGVCSGREDMPAYGVWAFPDETQGGVWTIDGEFDSFGLGLTRKDYCSTSGIGGNAMVPREECVYRSMPGVILNEDDDGCVRLYVVDCMEKYALRELVRDVDVPKTHEIELRGSFFDPESLIFPTLLDWSMEELDKNIKVGDRVRLKCDFLQAQDGFPAGMWCEWVVTGKYYQTEGNTDVLLTGLVPSVDSIYKIDIYFDTNAKYPQVNNTVHVTLSLLLEW